MRDRVKGIEVRDNWGAKGSRAGLSGKLGRTYGTVGSPYEAEGPGEGEGAGWLNATTDVV